MGRSGSAWDDGGVESARVDRWLWAVRVYPTRSAASEACRAGHVRLNDARAKPAATVRVGDTVRALVGRWERVVEVVEVIDARVGAPRAAECLVDRSPPKPPREERPVFALRTPGSGRPTGRDRRQLDRTRGR